MRARRLLAGPSPPLRPLPPSSAVVVASVLVLVAGALSASAVAAQTEEVPLLLPLPGLDRPTPVELEPGEEGPRLRGCATKPLPALRERLPFGPGELLSYDVAFLGIRTGKVNLRVGERTSMDGVTTYPLHGQARSDGFLEVLGNFDARMVSFFDPATLLPVRMVNRTVSRQPFKDQPTVSREDGAFAPATIGPDGPVGGDVNARLTRSGPDGAINRRARLKSSADVVDLLSIVYYLRSRELPPGAAFCFELYHRRRLWRVDGRVGDVELVRPPLGARRARRLETMVRRLGGIHPPPPRPVTVWMSDDADRLPVLVSSPTDQGPHIEVRLLAVEPGRRLVGK